MQFTEVEQKFFRHDMRSPNTKKIIRYLDFTSLYSYVNKYSKYPVGHPKIFKGSECYTIPNITTIDGLIKCKILPPQNLLIPVLPEKLAVV